MLGGASHDKWAPSADLLIFMADGAPGNPGKQVLNGAGCNAKEVNQDVNGIN